MPRLAPFLVAAALMALLVACGDDESEVAPSATMTTIRSPSPTPTSEPTMIPTPGPGVGWDGNPRADRLVAYLDSQLRLWLSRADGSGERLIAERPCAEGTEVLSQSFSWSPDSRLIGLTCTNYAGAPPPQNPIWQLVVFDVDGDVVAAVDNVNHYEWSADSGMIAYEMAGTTRVGVVDLASGEERILSENAELLAWPRERQLLLALNAQATDDLRVPEYDAVWYDVDTGTTARVQRLDDGVRFWAGPNGERAIVLSGGSDREGGGATMAVYDFTTGEETPLHGVIGYPAEGIPSWLLAFSEDGGRIYWGDVDFQGPGASIKTVPLDGGSVMTLGRVPSPPIDVAGAGLVLYSPPGDESGALVVHDAQTGAETELGDRRVGAISPP